AEPVTVTNDSISRILLDFDGNASVVSTGPNSLTFTPVIFEVSKQSEGTVSEVAGRVVSVGVQRFTLAPNVRPAGNTQPAISSTQTFELGQVDVITDSNTRFAVDGALFTGDVGLGQLAP